jgi:hypothetical protein
MEKSEIIERIKYIAKYAASIDEKLLANYELMTLRALIKSITKEIEGKNDTN